MILAYILCSTAGTASSHKRGLGPTFPRGPIAYWELYTHDSSVVKVAMASDPYHGDQVAESRMETADRPTKLRTSTNEMDDGNLWGSVCPAVDVLRAIR